MSLEVPKSFADLLTTIGAFPAFAASFALIAQIWYLQYRFFRRYGIEDGPTVALNVMLLFVVVFFIYPLKFLFRLALSGGAPQGWSDADGARGECGIAAFVGGYAYPVLLAPGLTIIGYVGGAKRRRLQNT